MLTTMSWGSDVVVRNGGSEGETSFGARVLEDVLDLSRKPLLNILPPKKKKRNESEKEVESYVQKML